MSLVPLRYVPNKLTKKDKKNIKKELKKVFGNLTEAKKQAKLKYNKVQKQYKEWNKLGKRKQLQTLPPSVIDTFLKINDVDFLYYSNSKGVLSAPNGKGFYVRLKTKCGVIDYKI